MATTRKIDHTAVSGVGSDESLTDSYRSVFELSPDPMWICDSQNQHFLAVNEAATLQYGYSRLEFLSLPPEVLCPAVYAAGLGEQNQTNSPVQDDRPPKVCQHRTKDGRTLDVEIRTRLAPFQGHPARLTVAQDVTSRRQAERILSMRYALTRLLSEGSADAVQKGLRCLAESLGFEAADLWMLDGEGRSLVCQASWRKPGLDGLVSTSVNLGLKDCERKGALLRVLASGAPEWIPQLEAEPGYWRHAGVVEPAGFLAGLAFAVRSQAMISGVGVLQSRSSSLPDPDVLQLTAETGSQLGHYVERTRIEQELRKAEETFHAFFEDAPVAYHEIDRNGTVVRVNRAECLLLGLDASEIVGKPVWELVAPDERERCRASLMRKLKEGRTGPPFERKYRTHNGKETVFRVHARPITGPTGQMIGIRTAMLDLTEAKRSRQQIEFQTTLLDQVQDAVVTVAPNFRVTYCNAAAERLFGCTAQDALGQPYKNVAGTVVSQAEREAIHQEILNRGRWNGEIICTNRSGARFLVHVSWSVLRDHTGHSEGVVGIHRDLTEPKQMEQLLRSTEDRLRVAQDALGVATWEWDFGPGMPKCSEHLLRLYGLSGTSDSLTFERWLCCLHPDDRSRTAGEVAEHRQRQEPFEVEFRVIWPDGTVHWLLDRAMVIRDAQGQPAGMVGVSVDITDQKLVEVATAELAAIVQCADAAIISKDLDDKVLTWNKGAERIYGYSPVEAVGQTMAVLIPPDLMDEDRAIKEKVRRGESVNHLETIRLTKSGERIHVLLTISPIQDRGGTVRGVALVVWDITQIKRLEGQLARAQKLESIGQLAAGIAHEINTPIQYIGDNARFLEDACRDLMNLARAGRGPGCSSSTIALPERTEATPQVEEGVLDYLAGEVPKAIGQLIEGVEQVARIVRAMNEFSHPGPIEKMPIDINRAIESTIVVSRNEWKYVAEVTTDFSADLPPIPCVAGEINQVILNLIVNAAHAIADVVKNSGTKGRIHISTRGIDSAVEIRIADTGGGIPPSIQSRVFDPFFTTKPPGKGTGQGLAIAHSVIVNKHNGMIRFETEPGSGTTFIIELPPCRF